MPVKQEMFDRYTVLRGLRPQSAVSLANKAVIRWGANGSLMRRVGDVDCDTLFLVSGSVVLEDATGHPGPQLAAGDGAAREALPTGNPAVWNVRCQGAVTCLSIDSALLEVMLDWSFAGDIEVGGIDLASPVDDKDWMMRLLQRRTFQLLPATNLMAMFQRMQPVSVGAGKILIHQGDVGDYFYVVVEGQCQAWRESPGERPLLLATFAPGECFGEESLLSGAMRSATVQALTAARLLRLPCRDFSELLSRPLLRRLSPADADARVRSGHARWLDVRMPNERQGASIPGSICIPAHLLRFKVSELPRDDAYICICQNGLRSAVAAFVLSQTGLDAYVLEGGLPVVQADRV